MQLEQLELTGGGTLTLYLRKTKRFLVACLVSPITKIQRLSSVRALRSTHEQQFCIIIYWMNIILPISMK